MEGLSWAAAAASVDPADLVLLLVGETERTELNTKRPVVTFLILSLVCVSETSELY